MTARTTKQLSVGIIGAGHMGSAIVIGLIRKGYNPESIWICDHKSENMQSLRNQWPQLNATVNPQTVAFQCSVLLLAVKPQTIKKVCLDLKPALHGNLIISIAAGITTQQLAIWLEEPVPIIRTMPNLPALINCGITGLYASPGSKPQQKAQAQDLLSAIGETIWFEEESQMDIVTALSGSGPGYFFYFIKALVEAGIQLGLQPDQALKLTQATALGSVKMLEEGADPQTLLQQVTSKGGTTEAAVAILEKKHLPKIISEALEAAKIRGRDLSQQY